MEQQPVVVTGANGFIATWLVKELLERGYHVRGTVRNPYDTAKVGHLRLLPGAQERLTLYKADLLDQGAYDAVLDGAQGVFHTASPVIATGITDPKAQLYDPAERGTLNLLESALKHSSTVKRVVLTSSAAATTYNGKAVLGAVVDESWWSDVEWCRQRSMWYHISKILAEKAAWDFVEEKVGDAFELVTINPVMVVGGILQGSMNLSSNMLLDMLSGSQKKYTNGVHGWVDVKDVAVAHVLAFEDDRAQGRYLCAERSLHWGDLAALLKKLYPAYPIPTEPQDETGPPVPFYTYSQEKVRELGLKFTPLEESIRHAVASFKERKLIN